MAISLVSSVVASVVSGEQANRALAARFFKTTEGYMASRKRPAPKPKSSSDGRKAASVSVDLDQLERLYSHERLINGRKDPRGDRKRDDGDGIRRDDTF
jgi:hypothetical protein